MGFPSSSRNTDDIILVPNQEYVIKCKIWPNKAEYYVDGRLYCTCDLEPGDVPLEGYPGVGCLNGAGSLFHSFKVEPITPEVISRPKPPAPQHEDPANIVKPPQPQPI